RFDGYIWLRRVALHQFQEHSEWQQTTAVLEHQGFYAASGFVGFNEYSGGAREKANLFVSSFLGRSFLADQLQHLNEGSPINGEFHLLVLGFSAGPEELAGLVLLKAFAGHVQLPSD